MSSKVETAKIEAEIRILESAYEGLTDSHIREITRIRIKECRTRLRQLQAAPRSPLARH